MTGSELSISIFITGLYSLFLILVFLLMYFKPPKTRNMIYGYRTPVSMKNDENWKYANTLFTNSLPIPIGIYTILAMLKTLLLQAHIPFLVDVLLNTMLPLPFLFIPLIIYVEKKTKEFEKQNSKS